MVLLLVTAPILLPEYRDPTAGRLDLVSVALSLAAILPVIYGLKELAKSGLDLRSGAAIVIGLAFGFAFVRRQKGLDSPLVDLRLFGNRLFTGAVGLSLFGCILWAGTFLLVTLYLQLVLGLSPLAAGLWLVPMNLGLVVATMLAPFLAQRIRPGYVMTGGMVITTLGLLLITQVDSVGGLPLVVTGLVLACTGVGPISSLGNGIVLASAPPEKAGSASSISETAAELGFALGVAVLGTIGAAVYRSQLGDSLDTGLPAEAAAATRESIAGAHEAAAQLPGQVGADLLETARDAFTDGLNVVAGISAALFLILAVVTLVLFRQLPPVHPEAAGDQPGAATDEATDESTDAAITQKASADSPVGSADD